MLPEVGHHSQHRGCSAKTSRIQLYTQHFGKWQQISSSCSMTAQNFNSSLSKSHTSTSTQMTDSGNVLSQRSLAQLSPSAHLPKSSFQPCIWISTCCYGNRHPASPARLVWLEMSYHFLSKKNKIKNPSHMVAFHSQTPLGTVKCSCWKVLQWVSLQLSLAAPSNPAQSTGLIRNSMPH